MSSTPEETRELTALLEMRGITKRFPGVLANDNIDFDVRAGEVHTLFGENGAGKSTLMRVLYGFYQPDSGEVYLDGKPVEHRLAGSGHRPRDRDDPPALHAGPDAHGGRERLARAQVHPGTAQGRPPRLGSHRGAFGPLRAGGKPLGSHLAAVGGRAPAGRDHQGALPPVEAPGARRAHGRPHPAGGGRPFPGAEKDGRRGLRLDFHLAQDPRGAGSLRPHHRAAGRAERSPPYPPPR